MKVAGRSAYASLFAWMTAVAALGLLLATFFRRQFPLPLALLALGLASATAVATLIVLMAYLQASSFNVLNVLYTSPSSPFVMVFTTIGLYSLYFAVKKALTTANTITSHLSDGSHSVHGRNTTVLSSRTTRYAQRASERLRLAFARLLSWCIGDA